MASDSSARPPPSPERIPRKQIQSAVSQGFYNDEQKENLPQRKPLPDIPIPVSGRLHGAPMSPVRISIQNEEYLPRPSSAKIEGDLPIRQIAAEEDEYRVHEHYTTQNSPKRESHTVYQSSKSHEPQSAVMESGGSSVSSVQDVPSHQSPGMSANPSTPEPVAQLQYHHMGDAQSVNRLLTPPNQARRSVLPRPNSTLSAFSDGRGRSPVHHLPHSHSHARALSQGRSPDGFGRPTSVYGGELLNSSYPQQAPQPISFDNTQLRNVVGTNASLLSTQKTLEMYRLNVKKTNDPSIQYAFALFLIAAAQEAGLNMSGAASQKASPKAKSDRDSPYIEDAPSSGQDLLREAKQILTKLADRSYPFAQYYLGDGYASGLFNRGKVDHDRAFPLFVAASKHGHAESGYRAALCYEYGWGCRKDLPKAVQFYRQSASKNHPGAMTRLGCACLSGDLGLNRYREGLKWLKRATDSADIQYNAAPYHLGCLYETGDGGDVFQDETYAAQLFTQAADLGHIEASYRLGDAYEHGRLSCPKDPALSVHFYTGAAQRGHAGAMMALCAWYMIGAEPVLDKDENEAYEWAKRSAELGLTKAEYATGYFTEFGIGCRRDPLEANMWYVRAAEAGDERAKHRLNAIRQAVAGGNPMEVAKPKEKSTFGRSSPKSGKRKSVVGMMSMGGDGVTEEKTKDEKECIVM